MNSPYHSESELCGGAVTVSFSKYLPLASDLLLTTLHPLLENVLQTVDHFEVSCLGAPFSWLEKPKNLMGRDLDYVVGGVPFWVSNSSTWIILVVTRTHFLGHPVAVSLFIFAVNAASGRLAISFLRKIPYTYLSLSLSLSLSYIYIEPMAENQSPKAHLLSLGE
jgi:hypothetical protein